LLLHFGAEREDRIGAEADARFERDGHRVIDAREFLDGDAQGREVGATASVLLGKRQTEEPELAHPQHDVNGEDVIAIPRFGLRSDLGLREVAYERAQRLLFFAQFERGGHRHRS